MSKLNSNRNLKSNSNKSNNKVTFIHSENLQEHIRVVVEDYLSFAKMKQIILALKIHSDLTNAFQEAHEIIAWNDNFYIIRKEDQEIVFGVDPDCLIMKRISCSHPNGEYKTRNWFWNKE